MREEDFNFRPPSSLSALPSRSPLSFGTIRHRRRSSRSPGGISLISNDNNNGDERSGRRAEGGGGGGAERTRRTTTITGIKPHVGLVRNSHIDRALRMEAGERFESSWSSKPVPSALVLRSVSLTLSLSCPRSPWVQPRYLVPFPRPIRRAPTTSAGIRVDSRQDYPVNNAPNSPQDLSCIIAKLFRSHFQSACLLLFGFFDSLSFPFFDEETASSRAP